MMLSLLENETQALRLLRLALEVDWMLGARLAGEVKLRFQQQTVSMVSALEVPEWLKIELWMETQSNAAIPQLLEALENGSAEIRNGAADALSYIGSEQAVLRLLKALEDEDLVVRWSVFEALQYIGSEQAVAGLDDWRSDFVDENTGEDNISDMWGEFGDDHWYEDDFIGDDDFTSDNVTGLCLGSELAMNRTVNTAR